MMDDITRLDYPIDVMFLMHKAFHEVSTRAEALAAQSEKGGDLTEFKETFGFWVKQLLYHADTEDKYMTAPLADSEPARDNEAEHTELKEHGTGIVEFMGKGDTAGLEENVKAAMLALEEEQHKELLNKAQDVEDILKKEMGEEKMIARTRRHLYRRVMAMRILEFDHFENEEAFVCSLVREWDEQAQLDLARRLLIDETADDPRWIIDWVAEELDTQGRKLLAELEARFQELPAAAG